MARFPAPSPRARWRIDSRAFSLDGHLLAASEGSGTAITVFNSDSGATKRIDIGVRPKSPPIYVDLENGLPSGEPIVPSDDISGTVRVDLTTGQSERVLTTRCCMAGRFLQYAARHGRCAHPGTPIQSYEERSGNYPNPYWPMRPHRTEPASSCRKKPLVAGLSSGGLLKITFAPTAATQSDGKISVPANIVHLIAGVSPVAAVAGTPDGIRLIATSDDGSVHVVPSEPTRPLTIKGLGKAKAILSPDKSRIAILGWGDVQCFDTIAGVPRWGRNLSSEEYYHAAWSPDGRLLVVAGQVRALGLSTYETDVFVINGFNGEQLAAFSSSALTPDAIRPHHAAAWSGAISGLAFSDDGKTLYISRVDGSLGRIDAKKWNPIAYAHDDCAAVDNLAVAMCLPHVAPARCAVRRMVSTSPNDGSRDLWLGRPTRIARRLVIRDASSTAVQWNGNLDGYLPTAIAWAPIASVLPRPIESRDHQSYGFWTRNPVLNVSLRRVGCIADSNALFFSRRPAAYRRDRDPAYADE